MEKVIPKYEDDPMGCLLGHVPAMVEVVRQGITKKAEKDIGMYTISVYMCGSVIRIDLNLHSM
jgi:hypothetical protein